MLDAVTPLQRYTVPAGGRYGITRPGGVVHNAWDMVPVDASEYVVAPERSTVRYVTTHGAAPLSGYDPGAVLLDGLGVYHVLGHLNPADLAGVVAGRVYEAGEPIARIDAGKGHVHWEPRLTMLPATGEARGKATLHPTLWLLYRRVLETVVAFPCVTLAARAASLAALVLVLLVAGCGGGPSSPPEPDARQVANLPTYRELECITLCAPELGGCGADEAQCHRDCERAAGAVPGSYCAGGGDQWRAWECASLCPAWACNGVTLTACETACETFPADDDRSSYCPGGAP
jgi:hypothetical protein